MFNEVQGQFVTLVSVNRFAAVVCISLCSVMQMAVVSVSVVEENT
jgi:hypothetical protein